MPKKLATENTKKVSGNVKKAEAAAAKQADLDAQRASAEADEWSKGAKSSAKKEAAAEKAAEAARKKAEKDALLKEEEANLPSKPAGNKKTAVKKSAAPTRGLDLSQLDAPEEERAKGALNASGIENALDALSLATGTGAHDKVDRHPERRIKAAYTVFEERRLAEMADEKGLRRNQKIELIRKEFEKSADNPKNQALVGTYDMSKEEQKELKEKIREEKEKKLEER